MLGDRLPLGTPFSVVLDISARCNFKCNYCFRSGPKDESWGYAKANGIMSWDVFERAAKQLAAFPGRIKSVSLSGHGEPMCNPLIVDMARQLKEMNVAENIEMHTNASLLTGKNVRSIAKAGFTRIIVSLQGLNASAYESVCGARIDWERFYNNLRLLYENKDENLKLHIKISDKALDKEHYKQEADRFYSLFEDLADSIFIENAVPLWKNISIDADMTKNKFGNDSGDVDYCPLVFYKMVVAPDGEIYPCTGLPTPMSIGNIHNTTIKDAWNSHARREFLAEHLRLTRHGQSFCADCFVPINTVTSKEDIIDPYKDAILKRLDEVAQNE